MTGTTRKTRWIALLLSFGLVAGACGGRDDGETTSAVGDDGEEVQASPGITDETIKLGSSYPLSGPASAYATIGKSMEACFDQINAEGGVESADGVTRQIEFIYYDDAYEPPKAVANVRRLVEQDEVFAVVNPLGTPNNTAIREYLNEQEVPQIYVATGASTWGADVEEFPWTSGWQPAYTTEAAIYGTFLTQEFPDGATVAILYQNDDFGKDYLTGFEAAIEGTNIEIVAQESYEIADPSIDSQLLNLSRSGADVFFNITTPKFAAQAISALPRTGWDPLHLLVSVSASIASVLEPAGIENGEGIYTAQYLKEPSDPQWAEDEAMIAYKEAAEEYGGDFPVDDPYGLYGFTLCPTIVHTLEQMEAPTREALMESVRNLEYSTDLLLPGITQKTGEGDAFPIEAMQLVQLQNGQWEIVGDVIDYEGETPVPEE